MGGPLSRVQCLLQQNAALLRTKYIILEYFLGHSWTSSWLGIIQACPSFTPSCPSYRHNHNVLRRILYPLPHSIKTRPICYGIICEIDHRSSRAHMRQFCYDVNTRWWLDRWLLENYHCTELESLCCTYSKSNWIHFGFYVLVLRRKSQTFGCHHWRHKILYGKLRFNSIIDTALR